MKRFLIILLGCHLFSTSAFALSILQDESDGAWQIQLHEILGQSFLATDTNIGSVGLHLAEMNDKFGDLTIEIALFSGDGVFDSNSLLKKQEFTMDSGSVSPGWVDLDVSGISFNEGEFYSIAAFNDTPQWAIDLQRVGNPYSNGTAYINSISQEEWDLRFRVQPIPEPSTLLLVCSGLIGMAGFRKRLRK